VTSTRQAGCGSDAFKPEKLCRRKQIEDAEDLFESLHD
jgi:hypothetical protein